MVVVSGEITAMVEKLSNSMESTEVLSINGFILRSGPAR